jgi:hypothetical protein
MCTWFWWGNEVKVTLGRSRCRWEGNTSNIMDLTEFGLYSSGSEYEHLAGFYAHVYELSGCIYKEEIVD